MVMFVVIIAIMSISMGVAVQTASFQMQREKEAELIFRGGQYVEAIRLYQAKYGRYPMQLKELWKAKPRVIRKQWKDPITDSENWGIVFLGQEGNRVGQQGRQGQQASGRQDKGASPIETQTPFGQDIDPNTGLPRSGLDEKGPNQKMGPIIGVHSTSCDEAIKVFEGRTTYCEWKFVYREDQQQGRQGGGRPVGRPTPNVPYGVPRDAWPTPIPGGGGTGTGSGGGVNPPPPIRTP